MLLLDLHLLHQFSVIAPLNDLLDHQFQFQLLLTLHPGLVCDDLLRTVDKRALTLTRRCDTVEICGTAAATNTCRRLRVVGGWSTVRGAICSLSPLALCLAALLQLVSLAHLLCLLWAGRRCSCKARAITPRPCPRCRLLLPRWLLWRDFPGQQRVERVVDIA